MITTINFLTRVVIMIATVISIQAITEFALAEKYGTVQVVVPIIATTTVTSTINIAYWLPKYYLSNRRQVSGTGGEL